jgi:hypothetical protein
MKWERHFPPLRAATVDIRERGNFSLLDTRQIEKRKQKKKKKKKKEERN